MKTIRNQAAMLIGRRKILSNTVKATINESGEECEKITYTINENDEKNEKYTYSVKDENI